MGENVVQGTATPARAVTFFDVDGTLMWRDEAPGDIASMTEAEVHEKMGSERPTQAVYGAIARLRAQGHAVFICTGRPYFLINEPLHELAPDGFICQAGAYACVGDTVIRDLRIPRDTALEAAAYLWREGIDVTLESNEGDVALYASDGACFFPGAITVRTPDELVRASEGYRFSKIATSELSPELLAHRYRQGPCHHRRARPPRPRPCAHLCLRRLGKRSFHGARGGDLRRYGQRPAGREGGG